MPCVACAAAMPAAAARRARSLGASTSVPGGRQPPARREEKRTRVRGGGGHAFDRLVRDQNHAFDAPVYDEAESALDAFWLARGVREEAYRARLVAQGALRDETSNLDSRKIDVSSLYRDPERLSRALLRLQALFPETNVAEMCWKEPAVLRASPRHVAASLVTLRFALPGSDVVKIVQGQPRLLLEDNAGFATEAAKALRAYFPEIDVSAVAELEPSLLTPECDVPGRLRRLEGLRRNGKVSPSVDAFVRGGAGSKNAVFFAKVFLEETRSGAETHENQGW